MDCKNDCGRKAISRVWKLCGTCFREQDEVKDTRPPEPKPVVRIPVVHVPDSPKSSRKLGRSELPFKNEPSMSYQYNKSPEEGTPYDWHKGKELTWKEVVQIMLGIWNKEIHYSLWEMARRFNLRVGQIQEIRRKNGLPEISFDHQKIGLDYTPHGPNKSKQLRK